MTYEDDRFYIPEKYRKMSIEELEEEKEKLLKEINEQNKGKQMKIRTSHVTNSSSSSFIIAYKKMPEFDKETLLKYPFLKSYGVLIENILMSDGYYETTKGEIFRSKEEVENYILDCYGYRDDTLEDVLIEDEDANEEYNKMIEYINKGYNVLQKNIDYCDDALKKIIKQINDGENIIVVMCID